MTERLVKPGERWTTFIFDGTDCELGVAVTNSSNIYNKFKRQGFFRQKENYSNV